MSAVLLTNIFLDLFHHIRPGIHFHFDKKKTFEENSSGVAHTFGEFESARSFSWRRQSAASGVSTLGQQESRLAVVSFARRSR